MKTVVDNENVQLLNENLWEADHGLLKDNIGYPYQ